MAGRGTNLAALIALVLLTAVWTWWACKEGAYFGAVAYPGIALLCAGLMLIGSRAAWGTRLALSRPAKAALGGMLGLAAWSALSAFWSPTPDIAVADAQRIFGYAVAFGVGLWLCILLGKRIHLAMAPLALAGLLAGIFTVATLLTGDDFVRYVDRGTLQFPIGYRNANAAFFLIALWPAATLAASRELDWRLRALALGAATLCLELAMLSQSRGSLIGAAAAIVVFLVASRDRARGVLWLVLAVIPALVVIPALSDLYQTAGTVGYEGTAEIRDAGRAALGGMLVAAVVGALVALLERRRPASDATLARANRVVAVGAAVLAVAGLLSFTIATGDPVGWVGDRVDEFLTQGSPQTDGSATRFGVNAGSERDDLWRVAVDDARDDPLLGLGGGGFQYSYLLGRSREGIQSARDAHSVELEIASELGFTGLALFGLAIIGAAAGAWRARGLGQPAAALSACALTVAAYWLAHSSLDWFWTYTGVTAPVFALLGSACAPASVAVDEAGPTRWRPLVAVGAAVLAVSVVPPYLSERYVSAAYDGWRTDPERAEADLDRARSLNPLSIDPLLAEGGIARAAGDPDRAVAAFEEAEEKRPEEWATHYFLSALHRRTDPARARAELDLALALNPLSTDLEALEERLTKDPRAPGP